MFPTDGEGDGFLRVSQLQCQNEDEIKKKEREEDKEILNNN